MNHANLIYKDFHKESTAKYIDCNTEKNPSYFEPDLGLIFAARSGTFCRMPREYFKHKILTQVNGYMS